jgi:hypothetical protein
VEDASYEGSSPPTGKKARREASEEEDELQPVRLILKLASKGAGTRKHTDLPSFVVENRFSPCLDPKLDGSAQSCKQQVLRLLTASRDSGDSEQSRLLLGPPHSTTFVTSAYGASRKAGAVACCSRPRARCASGSTRWWLSRTNRIWF